jgi:integrase/recombinase XerD
LEWQFGNGRAQWSRVRPTDIWRFAHHYVRGIKPVHARAGLGYVRRFLSFVHLRGACGPELAAAIPKVAVCGHATPEILSEQQRRALLDSFALTSPQGKRDYAMTLCMLDLGLRVGEVIGLRFQDIDWRRRRLTIKAGKTGRGRQLPLPSRISAALRDYIKNGRPQRGAIDHVFVRHSRRSGYPVSRPSAKWAVRCAYRRCGFPRTWSGTHRLRHTFASRLHKRGVDMKPIADLLGHQLLDSTNIYTHVDLEALRPLAQPWPR